MRLSIPDRARAARTVPVLPTTPALALVALTLLVLGGCASTVAIDYDGRVPFAGYSTYAFDPGMETEVQSLDESRVRQALREELAEEGLVPVAPDQADLLVRFRFEAKRRYESTGFSYGFGLFNSPFGLGVSTRPEARVIYQQQLIVELVEADEQQVVWQGRSREYLSESMGPQARQALIQELVAEMFKHYPPEP